MSLPKEIRTSVASLIAHGLTRIRSLATQRKSRECFLEADHLHNLPVILQFDSLTLLGNYWRNDRAIYVKKCTMSAKEYYVQDWKIIRRFLIDHAELPLDSDD